MKKKITIFSRMEEQGVSIILDDLPPAQQHH